MLLVVVEHDRGEMSSASEEALTCGRLLAATLGVPLCALTIGADADELSSVVALFGVHTVYQAHHAALVDYGPDAWGSTLAQAIGALRPTVVLACGTDRGNEVMAQAAARLDLPFVANCLSFERGGAELWTVTRVRWGGSLLESATVEASVKMLTVAHHSVVVAGEPSESPGAGVVIEFVPVLGESECYSVVRTRVERGSGVTLATSRVVVGGGRGVGSADGFAPLEALASVLNGVVGCSRAVTNNGWRPHTDQVGQTGTRIAPDIYLACGISGAIQHWVGAMAAKVILAINTDREANMVTRADYAVIGDLHQVIPAITAEIERRQAIAPLNS